MVVGGGRALASVSIHGHTDPAGRILTVTGRSETDPAISRGAAARRGSLSESIRCRPDRGSSSASSARPHARPTLPAPTPRGQPGGSTTRLSWLPEGLAPGARPADPAGASSTAEGAALGVQDGRPSRISTLLHSPASALPCPGHAAARDAVGLGTVTDRWRRNGPGHTPPRPGNPRAEDPQASPGEARACREWPARVSRASGLGAPGGPSGPARGTGSRRVQGRTRVGPSQEMALAAEK